MADGSFTSARTRSKLIGSVSGLVCAFGVFLLMAREGQTPHATLIGTPLLFGAILGLCGALGLLEPPPDAIPVQKTSLFPLEGEARWQAPIFTLPAACLVLVLLAAALGGRALPYAIVAALLILGLSALRRPGILVFVIASALYLPILGSFGLWDPWETHYGEVAREILARDDWISLWWAQDGWFWSKPILIFWAEALVWSASGVGFHADQHAPYTEWVLRLPIFAMAMTGLLAVYYGIARLWNRRAGVLATVVLATAPYYAFLTHQAITDMPFVANMTVAMMLLLLACATDPEQRASSVRIGPIALSMQHAVLALILCIGLPQLLYLASRNITWVPPFAWHRDLFSYGSAGNEGIPGNAQGSVEQPVVRALWFQPLAQALLFGAALALSVWQLAREKRVQGLYMFAFYAFCALSFLGKGIPGFALPGLVAFLYLWATGRFDLLVNGRLRVASGALVVAVLGLPWFVAMYMRHGNGFTDRILIHDHINRLTSGVHGDNGTIQYFIWQLGYGLFPWVGILPLAFGLWLRPLRPAAVSGELSERERLQQGGLHMLGLWLAVSFTLFSAMTTKFHHYIFPAVPPMAALAGLLLDRLLPRGLFTHLRRAPLALAALVLAPLACVLGAAGLRGDVRGIAPADASDAERARWVLEHPWPLWAALGAIAVGLALFGWSAWRLSKLEATPEPAIDSLSRVGPAALAGALLLAFVARDLSWHTAELPPGSERLIHLFVYNYSRPWPNYLDYRPILFGFGFVAVLLTAALSARRVRAAASGSLLALGLAFCVFCLDVYMVDLTPHWSQAGLIDRYYKERKSAEEPLVAWQMNWKGENFYSGNRVHVFQELDNKAVMEWVGKNKGRRSYFLLEHTRLERFKRLLAPREVETLTTPRDCNKFVLVRTTL